MARRREEPYFLYGDSTRALGMAHNQEEVKEGGPDGGNPTLKRQGR
jgi:hypothetical protein